MNFKVKLFFLSALCGLSLNGYSADKTELLTGTEVKMEFFENDSSHVYSVNFDNKAQWQLTAKPKDEEFSNQIYYCSLEYEFKGRKINKRDFPCNISDQGSYPYVFEVGSDAVIIDFPHERGGVAWLISISTTNEIDICTVPYMSGDEEGITFQIDDERNISAVTREDQYLISPNDENRFLIRKYEGSGVGLSFHLQY